MAITFQEKSGNLGEMHVTGLVRKSELDAVQAQVAKKFEADPQLSIKLLIIVKDFKGWEKSDDWTDISFYFIYGDKITKIAVVADPIHEDNLKMFMGGGIRPTPIKFFKPDEIELAHKWLA
jgi:hypothetical protein